MDLIEIIKAIGQLVPAIVSMPKELGERKDTALRAILLALDETYLYYRDQGQGRQRCLDREAQLARYWSAAAIPMRYVDVDLAERCDFKAEYWLDPDRYDEKRILETRIELNSVRSEYRALIRPRSFRSRGRASRNIGS